MADWYEPEDPTPRAQCPCCGYISLPQRGACLICPVCWWEDDPFVGDEIAIRSDCNRMTLSEGRANYARFGISAPEMLDRVHPTIRPAFQRRPLPTDEEIIARRPRTYFAVHFIAVFDDAPHEVAVPIDIQCGRGTLSGKVAEDFRYDNDDILFETMTLRLAEDRIAVTCVENEHLHGAEFIVGENEWVRVLTRASMNIAVNIGLFVGWPDKDTFFGEPPTTYDLRRRAT